MTVKKPTKKQEAFIGFYLGEATFNATRAAEMAGYAHPRQAGADCLSKPVIKATINQHLDKIRDEGIGNRAVRLAALNSLFEDLNTVRRTRAQEMKDRYEGGDETVPEGAETGLMIERKKQIGTGPNATIETEWAIDSTLVKEQQNILEQAAKEVGDRDKRLLEVSGPDGGPVQIESAKSKLLDLFADGEGDG